MPIFLPRNCSELVMRPPVIKTYGRILVTPPMILSRAPRT
jgi:hypothetical protein